MKMGKTRSIIAIALTLGLFAIITFMILLVNDDKMAFETFKTNFTIITSLITGAIGTVFGFYFGREITTHVSDKTFASTE